MKNTEKDEECEESMGCHEESKAVCQLKAEAREAQSFPSEVSLNKKLSKDESDANT